MFDKIFIKELTTTALCLCIHKHKLHEIDGLSCARASRLSSLFVGVYGVFFVFFLALATMKGCLGFNFANLYPARSLGDPTVHLY